MPEVTISQARDHFSALIADLEAGRETEYIIKNRNVPVAKITPAKPIQDVSKRIGAAKDKPFLIDDEAFDAMDEEIADMFGM